MSNQLETDINTKGLGYALRMIGQSSSISDQNRTVLLATVYELQITLEAAINDDSGATKDPEFMNDLRQVVLLQQERRRQLSSHCNTTFAAPPL